jgi:hypothetical protein
VFIALKVKINYNRLSGMKRWLGNESDKGMRQSAGKYSQSRTGL